MVNNPNFEKKIKSLIKNHQSKLIDVSRLKELMDLPDFYNKYQIIDTRSKEEYLTSHLPNAIFIDYKNFNIKEIVTKLDRSKTQVVYCSVGFRSGVISDKLAERGFTTLNLFGGIFEWSNRKFKLINSNDKTTQKVHTYNKQWSKWIQNGDIVY